MLWSQSYNEFSGSSTKISGVWNFNFMEKCDIFIWDKVLHQNERQFFSTMSLKYGTFDFFVCFSKAKDFDLVSEHILVFM